VYWYKFNVADWSLATVHLSLVEEAIYFRLINHYYDTEQPIPLETESVIRRLRLGSNSDTVQQILEEFFEYTAKGWIHSRCESELKEYRRQVKKNRENGQKGGRPNKYKASSISQPEPSGNPVGSQVDATNNPNHQPLTTNQEPIDKGAVALRSRFVKPTLDELLQAFEGKVQSPITEATKMLNYYESNGWRVGKNPMKSWRSAVANWITRAPPPTQAGAVSQAFVNRHSDTSWHN
jgi:uncharacterized protein YdaU (DUF1376 family)